MPIVTQANYDMPINKNLFRKLDMALEEESSYRDIASNKHIRQLSFL